MSYNEDVVQFVTEKIKNKKKKRKKESCIDRWLVEKFFVLSKYSVNTVSTFYLKNVRNFYSRGNSPRIPQQSSSLSLLLSLWQAWKSDMSGKFATYGCTVCINYILCRFTLYLCLGMRLQYSILLFETLILFTNIEIEG